MPQTFFHNSLYSQKIDLIHLTAPLVTLHFLQFCDIVKGTIFQKILAD